MKLIIFLALIVYVSAQCNMTDPSPEYQEWCNEWKGHKLHRVHSPKRDQKHYKEYVRKMDRHNKDYKNGKATYTQTTYAFSDLSTVDALSFLAGAFVETHESRALPQATTPTPTFPDTTKTSVNWTSILQPVTNQGQCGSCWTFASTAQAESLYKTKYGKDIQLSQQYLVDCDTIDGNLGCNGGYPNKALEYMKNNGVPSNASYYYFSGTTQKAGACQTNKTLEKFITNTFSINVGHNETLMKNIVAIQPVVITVMVLGPFLRYSSGVFSDYNCPNECRNRNHAVLLVGYGTDPVTNIPFWLVRNSWGPRWGENGYIRMLRNTDETKFGFGNCQVACEASFAT